MWSSCVISDYAGEAIGLVISAQPHASALIATPRKNLSGVTRTLLGFALCCLPLYASAEETTSPREVTNFDRDWKFSLAAVRDGQLPEFDDSSWRTLDLPHDWSAEHDFDPSFASGTAYLPGGTGWYRKTFHAPLEWAGRHVELVFDGIYRNSTVWINGKLVAERPSGYTPIAANLTPHLALGEKNVVAVRVKRDVVADSRWYPGSGIYRHVRLHVTEPVHVVRSGTFISTPRVTAARADISVKNEIINRKDTSTRVRVVTVVSSPDGTELSRQSSSVSIEAGSIATEAHWHVVEKPRLWSTPSPTLYSVQTNVLVDETTTDATQELFGVRTARFDSDRGFLLNEQPLLIKGLCLHHDAGVVGAAVPDSVLRRRLQLVKQLGANAVRCSHNPMADEFYNECDRLGLLVMDEAFDEWELGKRKWVSGRNVGVAARAGHHEHFAEWGERDVAEMVRRGRNHPSIILWSIGNEIDYPGDPYAHPEFFDPQAPPVEKGSPNVTRLAVVAPKLIAAVKRQDATRPVTMALSNTPASNNVGIASVLDVCGYNYQEQFYDKDRADFPGRVIYGSETGVGIRTWKSVINKDFIGGQFLWVGFDFLGEAGRWPNHGSQAGIFDTRGYLKTRGWLQKALWGDEPFVRVMVAKQRRGDRRGWRFSKQPRLWQREGSDPVPIVVVTNCEDIELKINGVSVSTTAEPDGVSHAASLSYQPGELRVTGLRSGKAVATDMIRTPGPATHFSLRTDRDRLSADGHDVAHLHVEVLDEQGILVPNFNTPVSVTVNGVAHLLGIDNGDQNDITALQHPEKAPRDGRLLVLVQALRESGNATVEVSAKGLRAGSLQLECYE